LLDFVFVSPVGAWQSLLVWGSEIAVRRLSWVIFKLLPKSEDTYAYYEIRFKKTACPNTTIYMAFGMFKISLWGRMKNF
jgi:hypothetical protein